ncbi:response regulator transcription factor [Octadecabacter sp. G9-8]|uniref:Response regulator transcription factor n=1 Tax=Octadecabacter dasysiphoniae TaxID=2909341 RepID=A0ABS9CV91_9RHOB|nr:response regulator transcription factor [Octadecabacter dasysiphoniae]MCF2870330.1 response regulator transcription factor [Octadecabacter dasysiphoniae]
MRLLVVEDEDRVAAQIVEALEVENFTVDVAMDGEDGHHLGANEIYHAIVLDLSLPRLDGVSVLHSWRSGGLQTPVLVLTARNRWEDRVEGLNAGGDDYLGKPFQMEELIARLNALIRRAGGEAAPVSCIGAISVDLRAQRVTRDGRTVPLTAHEYKVFATLVQAPDKVHAKGDLAEIVYGLHNDRDSNTIEVFVARLRRKLGTAAIETVRGSGYRIGQG